MKKPALLALAALMVVMSSACSKQAPAQTTPSSASETSSISAAEDSASNEPIAGVNYTSSSAAPLDESASQQAADVGIPQLQEPTAETKSLLAALESGDLSGIVGSYYSEKYGYATISEDGGITFAEVTDVDGNSYQNLKYMSFNPENGTGIAEMKTQGSLPYLY
jgi:hypothetical protein